MPNTCVVADLFSNIHKGRKFSALVLVETLHATSLLVGIGRDLSGFINRDIVQCYCVSGLRAGGSGIICFLKILKLISRQIIIKKNNSLEVSMSFTTITAEVQELTYEDKFELKNLLEKYLIEERRTQIRNDSQKALEMAKNGELEFTDDIDSLMN